MKELALTANSMLKKIYRPGERSLSRQEVEDRLQKTYENYFIGDKTPSYFIEEALSDKLSPFHQGSSHAVVEMEPQRQDTLTDELLRYLYENRGPVTSEQALKRLRRKGLISYSFQADKLPLYGDARFIRFKGSSLWYLSSWMVANDRIYDFLVERNMKQLPLHQLYLMMENEMGLSRKDYVFVLEGDSRFQIVDGNFVIVSYESVDLKDLVDPTMDIHVMNIQMRENINIVNEEVAATMVNELQTVDVFESVLEDMNSATEKLEQRINEMEEEVLNFFKENNMNSIAQLVSEKEKCENITKKIEEIMELLYGK